MRTARGAESVLLPPLYPTPWGDGRFRRKRFVFVPPPHRGEVARSAGGGVSDVDVDGVHGVSFNPLFARLHLFAHENRKDFVGADGVEWPQAKVLEFLAGCKEPAAQNTDFIECCRERKTFALNERNGFRSSTMFNLAIAAWRLGRDIDFDPVRLVSSDEEANRILFQHMREPWEKLLKA